MLDRRDFPGKAGGGGGRHRSETFFESMAQIESDIEALGSLFAKVVSEIQRLTMPPEVKIERVPVSEFLTGSFESADQIKEAIARLQDHLLKLLDEGVKIVIE